MVLKGFPNIITSVLVSKTEHVQLQRLVGEKTAAQLSQLTELAGLAERTACIANKTDVPYMSPYSEY